MKQNGCAKSADNDQDSSKTVEPDNDVKNFESVLAAPVSEQAESDKMRLKNPVEYIKAKKDFDLDLGGDNEFELFHDVYEEFV